VGFFYHFFLAKRQSFFFKSFLILAVLLPGARSSTANDEANSVGAGLKAEVISAKIGSDRRPVVVFRVGDSKGQPLDLDRIDPGSIKFIIASLKTATGGESEYYNYILTKVAGKEYVYKGEVKKPALAETIQPDLDRGGTLAKIKPGVFTYTFKTVLPANFDRNTTHLGCDQHAALENAGSDSVESAMEAYREKRNGCLKNYCTEALS
jgi:hypothetical protein